MDTSPQFFPHSFRDGFEISTLSQLEPPLSYKPIHKTQTFSNIKGGTGKTTLSTQFAMRASSLGNRTLFIDLDPQGHSTKVLGFQDEASLNTIGDVFTEECTLDSAIIEVTPTLSVIPGNLNLSIADRTLDKLSNRENRLKRLLEPIKPNWDLIVIDTNPAPNTLNANAFLASDQICVVAATDVLSMSGLVSLLDILEDFSTQFSFSPSIKIIPNLYDSRIRIAQQALAFLRTEYSECCTKTAIRLSVDIREAQKHRNSIWQYKGTSNAAFELGNLALELLNPALPLVKKEELNE